MEIPYGFIKDIEPLNIYKNLIGNEEMLICQIKQGNNFEISKGKIIEIFGTNLLFNVNESYENNAIGTPLISLSGESFGKVIGVKVDNFKSGKNKDQFAAHNIYIFLESIQSLVNFQRIKPEETLSEPKRLSSKEINILSNKNLKEIKDKDNNVIFESPGEQGITPLWFYRTHYAWFWTPTEPKNFTLEELLKCNWSLIKIGLPIKAFGGKYDGEEPAEKNIKLIQYLIGSKLEFLLE